MNREQTLAALENLLNEGGEDTRNLVRHVWERLVRFPETHSITLRCENPLLCQDIFLGCVRRRGNLFALDCQKLRNHPKIDFEQWLRILQQAGGFALQSKADPRADILRTLCFKIPDIRWKDVEQEITSKTELPMLLDAWKAADYLRKNTRDCSPAELGARLFHDSKRMKDGTVKAWTCRMLRQLMPADELEDDALLEKMGMLSNPTASKVMVYGPFSYTCDGRERTWIRQLWENGESACLTGDNLRNLERVTVARPVLTIENEAVFNRMMAQDQGFALVYAAGFPSSAVRSWIAALPRETQLRHWGDGDPEGLEIAAILHRLHPLRLFRCDAESLESMRANARELTPQKARRAQRLAETKDFPFPHEVRWILKNNRWLEQEAFFNAEA